MNPCDYCIDEECGGKHSCNCATCDKIKSCFRFFHPTIRITTKCTQSCAHCCFKGSPSNRRMMSVDMAFKVKRFLDINEIHFVNLMGGEIFCNQYWRQIIEIICPGLDLVRIVTNGDWVGTDFLDGLEPFKNILRIAISKDRWHNGENVASAYDQCVSRGFKVSVAKKELVTDSSIVPVGRAITDNIFSFFLCYCHNPQHKYSFLIDENGAVYKCSFGVWAYTNIVRHLDGSFAAKFKEYNNQFYGVAVPNCSRCYETYQTYRERQKR